MLTPQDIATQVGQMPPVEDPHSLWGVYRTSLRGHMLRVVDTPGFLAWSTIIATMFVGDTPYISTEMEYLRANDWPRWQYAIQECSVGTPFRSNVYPETSGSLIHQAYHLARWEAETGKSVADLKTIGEFGGGYGAMVRVARRAGFTGEYLIYDFPELALLQQYYLQETGIDNVYWADTLYGFTKTLRFDLLIGLWSFSETSKSMCDQVFSEVWARDVLLGYTQDHWFAQHMLTFNQWDWTLKVIGHLYGGSHAYLFGTHYKGES